MSITAQDDRITEYAPVVATTAFVADFPVFSNDDLRVFHDGVERVDFTVTADYVDGISTNATATFSPGITGDVKIVGARVPRRTSRFINGAPLPTRDQNLALDTVVAEVQEVARDMGRALKVPYGSAGYSIAAGITAGQLLVMGEDDEVEGGPEYGGIADAVTDAQNAAAAAALSEQEAEGHAEDAEGFSVAAAGFADAAADSQGQAQNLVDAAQAAYVGFQPDTFYDLGRVTDAIELFPGDLGRVSDI